MKKKGGVRNSKRTANKSNSFTENLKRNWKFIIIAIVIIFALAYILGSNPSNSAAGEKPIPSDNFSDTEASVLYKAAKENFLTPAVGVIFGLWESEMADFTSNNFIIGTKWLKNEVSLIIVYLAIWLILFVAFSDILSIVSPFSSWVSWVIGLALTVIVSQTRFIFKGASLIFAAAGAFGTIAIALSVIGAFVIFIMLSWGSSWARRVMMKIKLAKTTARASLGSEAAGDAIKNLTQIEAAMTKAGKNID